MGSRQQNLLKILFIDQYSHLGGGQTVLLQLIETALAQGFKPSVLAPMGGELEKALIFQFGSSVERLPLPSLTLGNSKKKAGDIARLLFYSAKSLLWMRKMLSSYSIIYTNGPRLFLPVYLASMSLSGDRKDKKFIFHVHIDHSKMEKQLISQIAKKHSIIFNSSFIRNQFFEVLPKQKPNANFRLISNALAKEFSRLAFEDRFTSSPIKNVALIGRISPEKGQKTVLGLAQKFPQLQFHLIGDSDFSSSDYRNSIRDQAAPNILFHGKTAQLSQKLRELNAQLSLIPSEWEEPFGLTAIESMACSCITLVSNRGELPQIAKNTGCFLYSTPLELYAIFDQILKKPKKELQTIAQNQFENAQKHYGFDRFSKEMGDFLQSQIYS